MTSSAEIDHNYVYFIKTFLVNRCFSIYCDVVYTKNDYPIEEYYDKLFEYRYDAEVWREVFNRVHHIFDYFQIINSPNTLNIPSNKIVTVYENITFQEYLEDIYDPYLSMQEKQQEYRDITTHPDKYTKMKAKYETETEKIVLKNHMIYLVNLCIYSKTNTMCIMTEEEKDDVDTHINIIPFFEYIGTKDISVEMIKETAEWGQSAETWETSASPPDARIQNLEYRVFNTICNNLL